MIIIHLDQKVLIEWELITNNHKIYLHESESQTLRKFVIEEQYKGFEGFSILEVGKWVTFASKCRVTGFWSAVIIGILPHGLL